MRIGYPFAPGDQLARLINWLSLVSSVSSLVAVVWRPPHVSAFDPLQGSAWVFFARFIAFIFMPSPILRFAGYGIEYSAVGVLLVLAGLRRVGIGLLVAGCIVQALNLLRLHWSRPPHWLLKN
jgi:hypothetical protein